MSEHYTAWVCQDCLILLANGDISPDLPQEQADALLSKFEDNDLVVPGNDTDTYSTSACEGCGDICHGERHEVTVFPGDKGPQHADYPHEPGTLYDCPACDMPA